MSQGSSADGQAAAVTRGPGPGTPDEPLRVAIIGAGPAGYYTAEALLRQTDVVVDVDLFDRLLTPYGLVRAGVAPDHQKIKGVTTTFDKVAQHHRFRFFGGVELGQHITVDDLRRHYHQIVYTTGAQNDRRLGIPGEDLPGSHPATEFVAWYNAHPDYRDFTFDLSQERVAVIGVGNVAVDIVRILARTPEELEATDIAEHALEALRASRVKEVHLLGRRGPAQAAFTPPEVRELGELKDADIVVRPEDVELDEASRAALEKNPDRRARRNVELLQAFAGRPLTGKRRRLYLRFCVSPVEIVGDAQGRVSAIRLVHNTLQVGKSGAIEARPTGRFEEIPVGLVFRSVGYRGAALRGVPFHDSWGLIPNDKGRVVDPSTKQPVSGEYTAGWIKRGPSGVIGTNKPDAVETVACMLQDAREGRTLRPADRDPDAMKRLVHEREPRAVSYADWRVLDQLEIGRGRPLGRPRVKYASAAEMLGALDRAAHPDR